MRTGYTIALSMLAGTALGATAIHGLHAQAAKPAYAVVDISEVTDPEAFKAIPNSPTTSPAGLANFGGHYIIRTQEVTAFDGTPPKRFVVIQFDNVEKAKAWNASAPMAEINSIRAKATKSRSFLVQGM